MMYIKLFDLKNEMLRSGEYLIDFSTNNFEVNFLDPFLKIQKIFLIEDKHLCRPDMISYDGYGDTDHIDAVLKFNQICNPFSMNIGDLILIPTDASLTRFYKNNATPSKFLTIFLYLTSVSDAYSKIQLMSQAVVLLSLSLELLENDVKILSQAPHSLA